MMMMTTMMICSKFATASYTSRVGYGLILWAFTHRSRTLTHKLNCTAPNMCYMKVEFMSSIHICTALLRLPVVFLGCITFWI
jgi:hypothetical protein